MRLLNRILEVFPRKAPAVNPYDDVVADMKAADARDAVLNEQLASRYGLSTEVVASFPRQFKSYAARLLSEERDFRGFMARVLRTGEANAPKDHAR